MHGSGTDTWLKLFSPKRLFTEHNQLCLHEYFMCAKGGQVAPNYVLLARAGEWKV